jgi:hypothetical protein
MNNRKLLGPLRDPRDDLSDFPKEILRDVLVTFRVPRHRGLNVLERESTNLNPHHYRRRPSFE